MSKKNFDDFADNKAPLIHAQQTITKLKEQIASKDLACLMFVDQSRQLTDRDKRIRELEEALRSTLPHVARTDDEAEEIYQRGWKMLSTKDANHEG